MLTELFALPINLRHVATIGGLKLYGSEALNENFIKAAESNKVLHPIIDTIKTFVINGKIIPIFANKNLITYLIDVINVNKNENSIEKQILGFFHPKSERIFIFIDNNTNLVWYMDNDNLGILVIHELIHMISHSKPFSFLKEFRLDLLTFYKDLFAHIFSLKDKNKLDDQIISIYTYFYKSMEMGGHLDFKKFKLIMSKLSSYTDLSSEQFNKRISHYFLVVKYFYTGKYNLVYTPQFRYILKEPYFVYKRKFNFFPVDKNCVQEFIIPSEVISTIVEYKISDKHYKVIKALI